MIVAPGDRRGWGPSIALAAAILAVSLAACSPAREDPGAVTADEAAQLNDAAAMLDADSIDLNAVTANRTDANP
jgi:acetyl-CoA acetyltransferase